MEDSAADTLARRLVVGQYLLRDSDDLSTRGISRRLRLAHTA